MRASITAKMEGGSHATMTGLIAAPRSFADLKMRISEPKWKNAKRYVKRAKSYILHE